MAIGQAAARLQSDDGGFGDPILLLVGQIGIEQVEEVYPAARVQGARKTGAVTDQAE